MLLRLLLEYYRREKKVKIALLECLYNAEPKVKLANKSTISFPSFMKIME